MNVAQAVRSILTQYATFDGRARRSEYWYWYLAVSLFAVVVEVVAAVTSTPLLPLALVAVMLPTLAVTVRRLHDVDRSGWSILIGYIPLVGTILMLLWLTDDGTQGVNRYGTSPKYP